jgi:hypothetical protein
VIEAGGNNGFSQTPQRKRIRLSMHDWRLFGCFSKKKRPAWGLKSEELFKVKADRRLRKKPFSSHLWEENEND